MNYPILYVILNGEQKMTPGKAAAQAVHAAMSLWSGSSLQFRETNKRAVIVLEAENSEQIRNLEEYLTGADLHCEYYIDEGVNEVSPYSITALAVAPIMSDDEEKREIFAQFPLYGGHIEVHKVDRFGLTTKRKMVPNGSKIESWWLFRALKGSK